jgi:hypothetical protein
MDAVAHLMAHFITTTNERDDSGEGQVSNGNPVEQFQRGIVQLHQHPLGFGRVVLRRREHQKGRAHLFLGRESRIGAHDLQKEG